MATRNLARTVVEGGRPHSNHIERDEATRAERHAVATFCNRARKDVDASLETALPLRKRVYREFADKLAPARRWLRSRVGRPWDETRSVLCRRFDRRKLKNWHLMDVHMLRDVEGYYRYSFDVDANGLLTYPDGSRRHESKESRPPLPKDELNSWLGGRTVGRRGRKLYWFIPTFHVTRTCMERFCELPRIRLPENERQRLLDAVPVGSSPFRYGAYLNPPDPHAHRLPGALRQGLELTENEYAFFAKLVPYQQNEVLKSAPHVR